MPKLGDGPARHARLIGPRDGAGLSHARRSQLFAEIDAPAGPAGGLGVSIQEEGVPCRFIRREPPV